jgi:hypothetical protein
MKMNTIMPTMGHFMKLLHDISKRPGMYVGEGSLKAVSHYLDGYDHAMEDHGATPSPLYGWMRWVEMRFLISHSAWHWTRILVHVYGSDGAALESLPSLYEEFLADRESMGVDGIEAELKRRLIAEYGEDWHAPEVTATRHPSEGL